jgi:hypothetical protein
VSIDSCDNGLSALEYCQCNLTSAVTMIADGGFSVPIKSGTASGKVCPSTKSFAGACHHHNANRVIKICLSEKSDQLVSHYGGKGVHPVRSMQCYFGYAPVNFIFCLGQIH